MQQHLNHKQLGFTLLELVIVLLLAAIILILGVNQYRSFKRIQELNKLKANIALIQHTLNNYYHKNCQNQAISSCNANRSNLQNQGYWPKLETTELIHNSADDNQYEVGVESISTPPALICGFDSLQKFHPCRLYVTAILNLRQPIPSDTLAWHKRVLSANSLLPATTLKWIMLPVQNPQQIDTKLWILQHSLERFTRSHTDSTS